jgi:hypothetical protein
MLPLVAEQVRLDTAAENQRQLLLSETLPESDKARIRVEHADTLGRWWTGEADIEMNLHGYQGSRNAMPTSTAVASEEHTRWLDGGGQSKRAMRKDFHNRVHHAQAVDTAMRSHGLYYEDGEIKDAGGPVPYAKLVSDRHLWPD